MSSEHSDDGELHQSHLGPPDLILKEIIAPSDVPEDIRERFETSVENRRDTVVPTADGGFQVAAPGPLTGVRWADVTFAGRALALIEGTDQPDCDGYGDPMQWVLALSADSPVSASRSSRTAALRVPPFGPDTPRVSRPGVVSG